MSLRGEAVSYQSLMDTRRNKKGVCRVGYLEIEKLFAAFLKKKQFLDVASPATIRIYSKSWAPGRSGAL